MEPMPWWQSLLAITVMIPHFWIILIIILLALCSKDPDKARAEREKVKRERDFLRSWAVRKAQEDDLAENPMTLDQFLTKTRGKGR